MDRIIRNVLVKLECNGFKSYIVGGYVRDMLLKKKSFDIDICTNALPKDVISIFKNSKVNNYGGV